MSNDPVLLEFNGEESDWPIETQPDRILFLSFPDSESSELLKESLTVSFDIYSSISFQEYNITCQEPAERNLKKKNMC